MNVFTYFHPPEEQEMRKTANANFVAAPIFAPRSTPLIKSLQSRQVDPPVLALKIFLPVAVALHGLVFQKCLKYPPQLVSFCLYSRQYCLIMVIRRVPNCGWYRNRPSRRFDVYCTVWDNHVTADRGYHVKKHNKKCKLLTVFREEFNS